MKEKLYFTYKRNSLSYGVISKNTFYESENFEWTKPIEEKWTIVRDEIDLFLAENQDLFVNYFDKRLIAYPKNWQLASFYFWGLPNKKTIEKCPETIRLIRKIPGIVSASVNILKPNTQINGHYGDTNAIYRCHLPLKVPGILPDVGFMVGEESRNWEPGKFLIFNDAAYHKAWNMSDDDRIILLIDVIKPEYINQKKRICSRVLSSVIVLFLGQRLKFILKMKKMKNALIQLFFFINWLYFTLTGKLKSD